VGNDLKDIYKNIAMLLTINGQLLKFILSYFSPAENFQQLSANQQTTFSAYFKLINGQL